MASKLAMKTGLLWFDDNPKLSLEAKIENASRRFQEKFGRTAQICVLHPTTVAGAPSVGVGVRIVESVFIRPDHFWLGTE